MRRGGRGREWEVWDYDVFVEGDGSDAECRAARWGGGL